jgi:hypothetical protein
LVVVVLLMTFDSVCSAVYTISSSISSLIAMFKTNINAKRDVSTYIPRLRLCRGQISLVMPTAIIGVLQAVMDDL